ncbi:MAG: hypothetical protein ACRAVC_07415 [Trichormus sp.]
MSNKLGLMQLAYFSCRGGKKRCGFSSPPNFRSAEAAALSSRFIKERQRAEGRRQKGFIPSLIARTICATGGSKGLRPPPNFQFGGSRHGWF